MALRSLVAVLKALPRRMPGSGAFGLKGNPCSKSSGKVTDPVKLGYVEEFLSKKYPHLYEEFMRGQEESRKAMRVYDMHTVLISIVGFGTLGHVVVATKV